jgi:hypothetical protein
LHIEETVSAGPRQANCDLCNDYVTLNFLQSWNGLDLFWPCPARIHTARLGQPTHSNYYLVNLLARLGTSVLIDYCLHASDLLPAGAWSSSIPYQQDNLSWQCNSNYGLLHNKSYISATARQLAEAIQLACLIYFPLSLNK